MQPYIKKNVARLIDLLERYPGSSRLGSGRLPEPLSSFRQESIYHWLHTQPVESGVKDTKLVSSNRSDLEFLYHRWSHMILSKEKKAEIRRMFRMSVCSMIGKQRKVWNVAFDFTESIKARMRLNTCVLSGHCLKWSLASADALKLGLIWLKRIVNRSNRLQQRTGVNAWKDYGLLSYSVAGSLIEWSCNKNLIFRGVEFDATVECAPWEELEQARLLVSLLLALGSSYWDGWVELEYCLLQHLCVEARSSGAL
jgi:hypothetical protein